MWPDFPKGVLYAHSFETHFTSPFVSYINGPTEQHCDMCAILLKAEHRSWCENGKNSWS